MTARIRMFESRVNLTGAETDILKWVIEQFTASWSEMLAERELVAGQAHSRPAERMIRTNLVQSKRMLTSRK